ncbi:MAG: hypothetical protein KKB59_18790 [Spirochaetes bacterium]|nr:hypothetical protein [Spirochaetota bacterium]
MLTFDERINGFFCNLESGLEKEKNTDTKYIVARAIDETASLFLTLNDEEKKIATKEYFSTIESIRDFIKTTAIIIISGLDLSIKIKPYKKISLTIPNFVSKFIAKYIIKKAIDLIFDKIKKKVEKPANG